MLRGMEIVELKLLLQQQGLQLQQLADHVVGERNVDSMGGFPFRFSFPPIGAGGSGSWLTAALIAARAGTFSLPSHPICRSGLCGCAICTPWRFASRPISSPALSGFFLLILAASLLRRKRVAWLLTVGLLVLSILSHLIKGFDYEVSLLAGGVLLPPPRPSPSFSSRPMPESLLALALACSSSIRTFLLVTPPFCLLSSCCCVRFFCGGNLRPKRSDDAPEPSLASMAILPWQTSPF